MKPVAILASPETLNDVLETWFVQNELFRGVPYYFLFEKDKLSNAIVIYLALNTIDPTAIDTLKGNGCKIVLFHMGDERNDNDKRLYAHCDAIIRNYFHDEVFNNDAWREKIHWVPNGYKTGIGPRPQQASRSATERHFLASFIGWLNNQNSHHNERYSFKMAAARCAERLFMQPTDTFNTGFNPGLYATFMESSVFCPCPAGNAAETIRLYDALEVGSIPISLRHSFLTDERALVAPPFPLLDSWDELPAFLEQAHHSVVQQPEVILALQRTCMAWWARQKSLFSQRLSTMLDRLAETRGQIT